MLGLPVEGRRDAVDVVRPGGPRRLEPPAPSCGGRCPGSDSRRVPHRTSTGFERLHRRTSHRVPPAGYYISIQLALGVLAPDRLGSWGLVPRRSNASSPRHLPVARSGSGGALPPAPAADGPSHAAEGGLYVAGGELSSLDKPRHPVHTPHHL